MTAPTWRSQNTANSGTGTVSTNLPAGFAADDILILTIVAEETAASIATPSGFTQIGSTLDSGSGTTGEKQAVFWKRATGSETTFNVADSGVWTLSSMQAFSGCAVTGDPIDSFGTMTQTTAGTSFVLPTLATNEVDTMIVFTVGHGIGGANNFGAPTAPPNVSGTTERTDYGADIGALGQGGGTACWTGTLAGTTTGGSFTATSGASTRQTGFIIALRPLVAPLSDTDTGSGTEGAESITGTVVDTDTGTGTDTEFIAIPFADTDTGTGTEGPENIVALTHHIASDDFNRGDESPLNVSSSGAVWTNV